MPRLKVEVTQEAIDNGQHTSAFCPVALTLKGLLGIYVTVTRHHISFFPPTEPGRITVLTPPAMRKWIDLYDEGHPKTARVEPKAFELTVPEEIANRAARTRRVTG